MKRFIQFYCVRRVGASCLALIVFVFLPFLAGANNMVVTNVLLKQSAQLKTCLVRFDMQWDNSWRNVVNHDAAWVFVKYSADGGATWRHATMKSAGLNPNGFYGGLGTNLDVVVPSDLKGVFLRRSSDSAGRVSSQSIDCVWDWNADALTGAEHVMVRVFALEMVYIPQGSFYAGSGGAGVNEFILTKINTANAASGGGYPDRQASPNACWPNGYSGYYVMKYEISQGLYRDFLNALTAAQSANRCAAVSPGDFMGSAAGMTSPANRNGIQKQAGGYVCNLNNDATYNEDGDGAAIACNWLAWADLAAFADWSALRPMTELEYEKACRGPISAVTNEYPWGASYGARPARGIINAGYNLEAATNAGNYANCAATNHPLVQGPMRCGAWSSWATQTTRVQAGAGYYGNMELAGNVWERCVTLGQATGRAYTGVHGDGVLTDGGDADAPNWPRADAVGAGARGGSWQDDLSRLMISDRQNAFVTDAARTATYGGRCVRTVP